MTDIDWRAFDCYPLAEIECACGEVYRSHSKYVGALRTVVTEKPCPNCGMTQGHVRRASHEPERVTIR